MVEETLGWPDDDYPNFCHIYLTFFLFSYLHIFVGNIQRKLLLLSVCQNINKTITFSICQGKWKEKRTENSNKELYYEKLTFSFFYFVYMYMHCYFPTLDILKLCGKGYWKAIAMHALPSSRDWFWLKRIFANAV